MSVNAVCVSPLPPQFLKESVGDKSDVKWNFGAKFIIDKAGNVVERNGDSPAASEGTLKKLLAA